MFRLHVFIVEDYVTSIYSRAPIWESIQFVYSKIIQHPHWKQLPFVVQTVLPTYDMKIQNENMTTSNMPVSIGQFICYRIQMPENKVLKN